MSEPITDAYDGAKRIIELQTEWQSREPTMRDRAEIEAIKVLVLCRMHDDVLRRLFNNTERPYL